MMTGSYGFTLTIVSGISLEDSDDVLVVIRRPNGSKIRRRFSEGDVTIVTASTGRVSIEVEEGDFPIAGTYKIQVWDETDERRIGSGIARVTATQSI
jgi:uncharacterized protein YjlB